MVVKFENVLGFFNGFESGDEKSVPAGVPMGTCWAGVLPLPFCQAFPSQALHPDAHLPPAQLPTRVYSTYHSPRHGILFESSATSPSTSPMAFYHFAFLGLLRNLASSQNLQSIALHPRPLFNIHQILWSHRIRQSLLSLQPHSSHLATPGWDKDTFSGETGPLARAVNESAVEVEEVPKSSVAKVATTGPKRVRSSHLS